MLDKNARFRKHLFEPLASVETMANHTDIQPRRQLQAHERGAKTKYLRPRTGFESITFQTPVGRSEQLSYTTLGETADFTRIICDTRRENC